MNKYVAEVKNNIDSTYEIEGYAKTPQDFHKIVLNQHIDYVKDEILFVYNSNGKKVFNHNRGFSGT